MAELETLVCEIGGHEWERPLVRGGKPRFCPVHRAEGIRRNARERIADQRAGRRPAPPSVAERRRASPSAAVTPPPPRVHVVTERRTRAPLRDEVELERRREQHQAAHAGPAPAEPGDAAGEKKLRPFVPLYGHLTDAVLALKQGDRENLRLSLQRLSATAELLSLDPALTSSPRR